MKPDAWSNRKDMSTRSEERRRAEAALVRAVDVNPDVAAEGTRAAICAYVDMLADDGLLPEAVVIAFKTALSPGRVDASARAGGSRGDPLGTRVGVHPALLHAQSRGRRPHREIAGTAAGQGRARGALARAEGPERVAVAPPRDQSSRSVRRS